AEDGIRDRNVTGVQTCALPISNKRCQITTHARIHVQPDIETLRQFTQLGYGIDYAVGKTWCRTGKHQSIVIYGVLHLTWISATRSEERRVGKGCRGRW